MRGLQLVIAGMIGCLANGTGAAAQTRCDRSAFKVALDIGHDRTRPGATSARGRTEFSYNDALGATVLEALRAAGFGSAFLIGESGAPMPLLRRPEIAREAQARLFVSLHHDSAQLRYFSSWQFEGRTLAYSDVFNGYSIFVSTTSRWAVESRQVATDLGQALRAQGLTPSLHHAESIPGESRLLLDQALGIYAFGELAVLRQAAMPALLLEGAVIVNRAEESAVQSGAVHPKIAAALVTAIGRYCERHR